MDSDLIETDPSHYDPKKNLFSSIDRLVIETAVIAASLIPTVLVGLVLPWRLAPLITGREPEGRHGLTLGAGLYFLVAIITAVFVAGATYSPDLTTSAQASTQASPDNASFFGPSDSIAVAHAIAKGDFSQAILVITPIFLLSVFSAIVTLIARPLLGQIWTLQASIKAWLYFIGTSISVVFFAFAVTELLNSGGKKTFISGDVPILVFLLYFFASLFRRGFKVSWTKTAAATAICLLGFIALLIGILFMIRL